MSLQLHFYQGQYKEVREKVEPLLKQISEMKAKYASMDKKGEFQSLMA